MTLRGDFSAGHVGGPFSCTEICLKDVPEMGYRHTDTWHGADPRDGAEGGIPCGGRGEVGTASLLNASLIMLTEILLKKCQWDCRRLFQLSFIVYRVCIVRVSYLFFYCFLCGFPC